MNRRNLSRSILALPALLLLAALTTVALAQGEGFSETFDNPDLPGWEHSPNAQVVDRVLRIESGGFAFHPGGWQNFTLSLRLRRTGAGGLAIEYRSTDVSANVLVVGPDLLAIQRRSGGEVEDLERSSFSLPEGEWVELRLQAEGAEHEVWINGVHVIGASDSVPVPPGGLILRTGLEALGEFDDLSLTAAGAPAPTEPVSPDLPQALPAYMAEAWVPLGGPPGDLGYDIRYNFADPQTWYVTDGNGGFFISNDRGLTWHASNTGIGTLEGTVTRPVFSATVDPHNPQTIWIGTQIVGHIYKSTDGGLHWVEMDNGVTPNAGLHFRGFTVDPRSSDIVYAQAEVDCYVLRQDCLPTALGTQGGRVYRTTDGGQNWEIIWEGEALARYLWIDPADPQVMYVSTGIWDRNPLDLSGEGEQAVRDSGLGILKTTDGGETWTILGRANGLGILHVGSLYMHPRDSNTLLAGTGHSGGGVTESGEVITGRYGGAFLTTDGGQTWQEVIRDDLIGAVEFCAQDPRVAYAGGWLAFYRSEDGGHTWQKFGDPDRGTWGPPGMWPGVPIDIQTDPDDCRRVFINNYIGGNFLSADGGESWVVATQGYTGAKVMDVEVDPEDAAHVYAAVRMGTFVSRDAGQTWEGISNFPIPGATASSITLDPSDSSHLLGVIAPPYRPGTAFETRDGGDTWQTLIQFPIPADVVEGRDWYAMGFWRFAFAPADPTLVYVAVTNAPQFGAESEIEADYHMGLGIYRSEDGGSTWEPANDSSTETQGFGALAVSPADAQTVLAGSLFGEGLFKTSDGGETWRASNAGLPVPYPSLEALAFAPSDPQIVLAGGLTGLYRSRDGGESWSQLTAGLDPFSGVRAVAIDPSNSQVMYVGTSRLGVFYSNDGGDTFNSLTQGLPTDLGHLPTISLAISQDGRVLYAGTSGAGVWRLGTPSGSPPAAEATPTTPAPTAPSSPPIPRTAAPTVPLSPSAAPRPPVNWLVLGLGAGVIMLAVLAFLPSRRNRR